MPLTCTSVFGQASPSYRTTAARSFDENARALARQVVTPGNRESSDLRARIDHPISAPSESLLPLDGKWEHDYRRMMIDKCLGEKHPYYGLALQGGAMQHQWSFKQDVGQQLLEKAVAILEESLGDWHPDCISARSSLGGLYREMGKFDRAESLLTKALKATAEVFGSRNPRYSLALQDLAKLHQYTNRLAEAETLLVQAVEAGKNSNPRDHANAQVALSEVEVRLGEREKASALLKQAQETLDKLAQEAWEKFNKDHRREHWLVWVDLANARVHRGWMLLGAGQADEARKQAREAFMPLVNSTAHHRT